MPRRSAIAGRTSTTSPKPGAPKRPALRDVIERAEADAGSDEAYFLAQLREVVAAFETPADRLLARYREWPSGPAQFYGKRRDWADARDRTARITEMLIRITREDAKGSRSQ